MKKTKSNLTLRELTLKELQSRLEVLPTEEARQALSALLETAKQDPGGSQWLLPREICSDEGPLGYIAFTGRPTPQRELEARILLLTADPENRLFSEALCLLRDRAFAEDSCYYIRLQIRPGEDALHKVLTDFGFVCIGAGRIGPLYELERPKTNATATFMALGLAIGVAMGVALDNLSTFMPIGMLLGMALGTKKDKEDKARRRTDAGNPFDDFFGSGE